MRVCQSQHVAPLLAEAGEVEAGEVHEGDVGGEDDVVGGDGAVGGGHLVVGDVGDFGVLVDDQRLRHAPEELQRVELCLVGEHHRSLHREGQAGLLHELRPKAQVTGGVPLLFQGSGVVAGVEVGGEGFQVAGDVLLGDDVPEIGHRLAGGTGVAEGVLGAEAVDELGVAQAVLGGDLGGRVLGLAAAHSVGLQNDDGQAVLPQEPGGQNTCHASAQHNGVTAVAAFQGGMHR